MCKCIYCLENADNAVGREHVVPECLGSKIQLERGMVCDSCNDYLSQLDKTMADHPILAMSGMLFGIERKGGKKLTEYQNGIITLSHSEPGEKVIRSKIQDYQKGPITRTEKGNTLHIQGIPAPPTSFSVQKFSRALHKTAMNFMCMEHGREFMLHEDLNIARKYIRNPISATEYRPYGLFRIKQNVLADFQCQEYKNHNTNKSAWIVELVILNNGFVVCISLDHREALKVLESHKNNSKGIIILNNASKAKATFTSRKSFKKQFKKK